MLQGGLAVVVSPSLRQSGFLFRKLSRHLVASGAAFRRETMTEVELVSGGLAVSLLGDRPAMLRGLSLRHDGPAVLLVDEASRVRDELWATISPMLAAAPAAQQILLSTPAGASGEFHRAWSSDEDWERVQEFALITLIVGLDVVAGYSLTARLARRNLELERQRRASAQV